MHYTANGQRSQGQHVTKLRAFCNSLLLTTRVQIPAPQHTYKGSLLSSHRHEKTLYKIIIIHKHTQQKTKTV